MGHRGENEESIGRISSDESQLETPENRTDNSASAEIVLESSKVQKMRAVARNGGAAAAAKESAIASSERGSAAAVGAHSEARSRNTSSILGKLGSILASIFSFLIRHDGG
jgi:hypothetical protein